MLTDADFKELHQQAKQVVEDMTDNIEQMTDKEFSDHIDFSLAVLSLGLNPRGRVDLQIKDAELMGHSPLPDTFFKVFEKHVNDVIAEK